MRPFLCKAKNLSSCFSSIFIFLSGQFALAAAAGSADFSAALNSRSTPVALQVESIAGYTAYLWGDPQKRNPFYGYVRPSIDLAISSTATGIASLDIYPVSFFGFTIGKSFSNRRADLPSIDCDKADCRDWLNSSFLKTRLLGRSGDVLGSLTYQQDLYESNNDLTRPFGDGSHVVLLAADKEISEMWQGILAYSLIEDFSAGIIVQDFRTHKSKERQEQQLLFARKTQDEWVYTLGLGRFASDQFGVGPQAIFSVTWVGKDKIAP